MSDEQLTADEVAEVRAVRPSGGCCPDCGGPCGKQAITCRKCYRLRLQQGPGWHGNTYAPRRPG